MVERGWATGRETKRDREGEWGARRGMCVCEIQPSCSAGNNGREASVEMQIRERVADSLIHVRGLWFRATRTAAYTRGIKEFVLEFCTRAGKWRGGGWRAEGIIQRYAMHVAHSQRLSHLRLPCMHRTVVRPTPSPLPSLQIYPERFPVIILSSHTPAAFWLSGNDR